METGRQAVVTAITQITLLDARGNAVPTMRIDYRVGDDGPFYIEIPKSEFTAANVKAKIEEEASEIRRLMG